MHGDDRKMPAPIGDSTAGRPTDDQEQYDGFSRFMPSRGNDPDSDYYLGKLIPGLRTTGAGPAPFVAPDLEKLPWKMVGGAEEFNLVPMAVEREFVAG